MLCNLVQEYLADFHAGRDCNWHLTDIGEFQGQAAGETRMKAGRSFDYQPMATK